MCHVRQFFYQRELHTTTYGIHIMEGLVENMAHEQCGENSYTRAALHKLKKLRIIWHNLKYQ
jgi:hypothetical protein